LWFEALGIPLLLPGKNEGTQSALQYTLGDFVVIAKHAEEKSIALADQKQ
jgi:hypothetical protein